MKNKGFTLIEILVVVAIVCVLLSIAVPPFAHTVEKYRYKESLRTIRNDLHQARALSFTLAKEVFFISNGSGYRIEYGSGVVFRQSSFNNVLISSSLVQFSFHPSGRLQPLLPVEIEVSGISSGEVSVIEINPIGNIRIKG